MIESPDSTFLGQKIYSSLVPIKNLQGDWPAYLRQCARYHASAETEAGCAIEYQRQCALAYLGKRAQLYGGVGCSKQPRIFTPKLHAQLERLNKATRFSRYPWLETLLNLLAKIEQIQEQAGTGNLISLVSNHCAPATPLNYRRYGNAARVPALSAGRPRPN